VDEATWLALADPRAMLLSLRREASDRKVRLFACACCRRIWDLLPDEANRGLVAAVEDRPDGTFDDPELNAALVASSRREHECAADPGYWAVKYLGRSFYKVSPVEGALAAICHVQRKVSRAPGASGVESAAGAAEGRSQCALLCDIFGPLPFRPVAVAASWTTSAVIALARGSYDDRRFEDLPVLADALEEAGCTAAEILGHLRGPGPHVRGCWVLDLVLGKI
jgi:hypothetical protein